MDATRSWPSAARVSSGQMNNGSSFSRETAPPVARDPVGDLASQPVRQQQQQQRQPLATTSRPATGVAVPLEEAASREGASEQEEGGSTSCDPERWRDGQRELIIETTTTSDGAGPLSTPARQIGKLAEQQRRLEQRAASQTATGGPGSATGGPGGARGSLLEALIGERGRSWRNQRSVVVEIRNGRPERRDGPKSEPVELERVVGLEERVGERQSEESKREAPEQQQVAPASQQRRVPTFGNIPQRLTRLPYFAYHGRARHVELTSAEDRKSTGAPASRYQTLRRSDGSAASLSSSRASQQSSSASPSTSQRTSGQSATSVSSSSSSNGEVATSPQTSKLASDPTRANSSRATGRPERHQRNSIGYSNISNLFPNEPSRARSRPRGASQGSERTFSSQRSASSLNLNQKQVAFGRPASTASAARAVSRRNSSTISLLTSTGRAPEVAPSMRRQNAPSQQPAAYGGPGPAGKSRQVRGRPSSAAGNYLSAGHQRSPSGSSLHYGRLGGSGGTSPYGRRQQSPGLLDPDCPVHGGAGDGGRPYAPTAAPARRLAGYQSQPDLLYEQQGHLGPASNYYDRPAYRASAAGGGGPLSPSGDRFGRTGSGGLQGERRSRSQSNGNLAAGRSQQAYYNSASRFSVFHGDVGGVRSSLAPTSEQLRRILGYKPASQPQPVHLHPQWAYSRPFIHLGSVSWSPLGDYGYEDGDGGDGDDDLLDYIDGPRFAPFNQLLDSQAVRAVDFHPSGTVYAVGSNSRALRICAYPAEHELRHFNPLGAGPVKPPRVLFKFLQVHRGSIYCVSFNSNGQLLATGSNDQTVHIVRYNSATHSPDGDEFRLTMHNGTVRDLCFIDDSTNGSALLLSAGGGDNKIYVTDCDTITPFQSMAGHTQMVMGLHHVGGAQFVSGSYDRTIRFWDLRTRACTSIVSAPPAGSGTLGGPGAPVCALRADPSGRLLASGHADSTCMLYDIRGGKIIQSFRPHDDEIRAVSFSPKSYYLLTGAYDGRLVVSDLQGDLTQSLPSVCAAESRDKVVQAKWHPTDFTFVSTGADKAATLWALPGDAL